MLCTVELHCDNRMYRCDQNRTSVQSSIKQVMHSAAAVLHHCSVLRVRNLLCDQLACQLLNLELGCSALDRVGLEGCMQGACASPV